MCDNKIACTFDGHGGRVSNLHFDELDNNVVGDFFYRGSNSSVKVKASSLTPLNKKAEKTFSEKVQEVKNKQKEQKKKKKEPVLN